MYSQTEFNDAFEKTRKDKHPGISRALGETVMKKFVERWENNRQKQLFMQEAFGTLIRLTLNELNISGKSNRQMYSALIGYYYSKHAAYANRRKAQNPRPDSKKRTVASPIGIIFGENGQAAWQL